MPFMHSEDLEVQKKSVELFTQLAKEDEENFKEALRHAKIHYNDIKKFGRFPYRNKLLGRETTPEEEAYLLTLEKNKVKVEKT